jgi:ADP-ribose pyrophosphatase YjhB (NUDIX family)
MANFCPECGKATIKAVVAGRERDACPDGHFVQFARTKIGVGALVFRGETVLLVQRKSDPHGIWTLPSGYQEEDETLAAALVREVWEETGLNVYPRGIVFHRNMIEHGMIDTYSVFLCDVEGKDEPFVNDHESLDTFFAPVDRFDELNMEADSRWFVETYLELQPEPMLAMANPFNHPNLQIFTA